MQPGTVIAVITVTDMDSGLNAMVELSLVDNSGLFNLNSSTGELKVQTSLSGHLGSYSLTVVAHDMGTPVRYSYLNLTVHVVHSNNFAPQFSSEFYSFEVNETDAIGVDVGQVSATDADGDAQILSYSLSTIFSQCTTTFPFVVDRYSGKVTTVYRLDREQCATYSFTVVVQDNGRSQLVILVIHPISP
jgi:protocadherin alpha